MSVALTVLHGYGQCTPLVGGETMSQANANPASAWSIFVMTIYGFGTYVWNPWLKKRFKDALCISTVQQMRLGQYRPSHPALDIGGMKLTSYYYLVDGLYPNWRIFICKISAPQKKRSKRRTPASKSLCGNRWKGSLVFYSNASVCYVCLADFGRGGTCLPL